MEFFRFDAEVRREIKQFGSKNVGITPIQRTEGPCSIGCMHFSSESVLGMHPATCQQLFLVVEGEGWVRVSNGEKFPVHKGVAVYWTPGEEHESGSETGMVAFVVEGDHLNPLKYLKELEGITL
ncbi:MAG TPA: cupin domain-containing protein [Pseudoneobacillus sp.]|nr:cupin domain-containing protein [Pseudoneobacillus sp.]